MSKPKSRRTAGPAERPQTRATVSLTTARRMLPLVARIVAEIQARWQRLTQLETEQQDLDRRRRALAWPQRERRYQVADEIAAEQRLLQDAVAELEQLEVLLVDPVLGEAAYPTTMNGRRAYFIWRAGTEDVNWWCYAQDPTRHPLPANWRRDK